MLSRRLLLRLPAFLVAVVVGAALAGESLRARFLATENIHSAVKGLLEGEHAAILHMPRDLAAAAICALGAGLARRIGPRVVLGGTLVAFVLLFTLPSFTWLPTALVLPLLVGINLLIQRLPAWALWIPGVELLLPLPTLGSLGLAGRPWMRAFAMLPLVATWAAFDAVGGARWYEPQVADWPDFRVFGAEIIGRADPGVRCDFHDIDVIPAHDGHPARAVVVTESALRLWSVESADANIPATGDRSPPFDPRDRFHRGQRPPTLDDRAWALPPWWGPAEGLVMDSETDPASDITWFLDGPATVTGIHWNGSAWDQPQHSPPLPVPYTHAYTRWIPERNELVLVSVNARSPANHPRITTLHTPDLTILRTGIPTLPDGSPLPTAREIVWVPPLGRLVIAPDFGDWLYLVDPDTLHAERWIEFAAMDGKMEWVDGLDRLALASPSDCHVWLVDPKTGKVDRKIPTQIGVRALAFDTERGRMWTASVVTGSVLAQRIEDGSIEHIFSTFMPMVRELRVLPDTGDVWLGTWTRLYSLRPPPPPLGSSSRN